MAQVTLNRGSDGLFIVDLVDDDSEPLDLTGATLGFFEPSPGLVPVQGQPVPLAAELHDDPGAVRVAIRWSDRIAATPLQSFQLRVTQGGDDLFPGGRVTTTPEIRVRWRK